MNAVFFSSFSRTLRVYIFTDVPPIRTRRVRRNRIHQTGRAKTSKTQHYCRLFSVFIAALSSTLHRPQPRLTVFYIPFGFHGLFFFFCHAE